MAKARKIISLAITMATITLAMKGMDYVRVTLMKRIYKVL